MPLNKFMAFFFISIYNLNKFDIIKLELLFKLGVEYAYEKNS